MASPSPDKRTWRHLYSTKRWYRLRWAQLQKTPLFEMCSKQGLVTAVSVVDHRKAHKGDDALFHDPTNLASLCKLHHDAAKQKAEMRGLDEVGCNENGFPLSNNHHWKGYRIPPKQSGFVAIHEPAVLLPFASPGSVCSRMAPLKFTKRINGKMILPTIAWLSICCMAFSSISATLLAYYFGRDELGRPPKSIFVFATVALVLLWAAYESFPFKFGGV